MENKCEHCKYRHSWDCDDGLPYPKGGCESFTLDENTLTKEQLDMLTVLELYNKKTTI